MSVKLIILGLLMSGDKHPYEMQHFVKERRIDKLIKLYKGSLYYAVDQLKQSGFIEVVEIIKEDKRPDKTVYKITYAGKMKFQDLLLEQFSKEEQYYDPLYSAVMFARYGDKSKIEETIIQKINYVTKKIKVLENMFEERRNAIARPAHYIYISQIEHARTDLNILQSFLDDTIKGNIEWVSPDTVHE